jgi:hypothetical protein
VSGRRENSLPDAVLRRIEEVVLRTGLDGA